MQAGYGRDTLVLASVAVCLSVLVGCVEATRLSKDLAFYPAPSLGDQVVVRSDATAPAVSFKARLPSGATCSIPLGGSGGTNGSLLVVTRASSGDVGAIWSQDRMAQNRSDCGDGALIKVDGATFANLELSSRGPVVPLEYPGEL
jgi:hypothetical protein